MLQIRTLDRTFKKYVIHKGGLGVNGPVVLDFNIPALGTFPTTLLGRLFRLRPR